MTKASLTLLKLPVTAEQLAVMVEKLTRGRPTEQWRGAHWRRRCTCCY